MQVSKKAVLLQHKISRSGAVVARWAHNPKVVRSSRASATKEKRNCLNTVSLFYFNQIQMFVVYVLNNDLHQKIYIGFTSDIEARLIAHNHPANKGWTKKFQPWKLIYSEHFETKTEAMIREKQLKSQKGREFIKNEILKIR